MVLSGIKIQWFVTLSSHVARARSQSTYDIAVFEILKYTTLSILKQFDF